MILHSWSKNLTSVSKPSAQTGLIVGNKGYCRIPLHAWTDLAGGGGGRGGAEAFPLLLPNLMLKNLRTSPFGNPWIRPCHYCLDNGHGLNM